MRDDPQLRDADTLSKPWLTLLVWRAPLLLLVIGAFTGSAARTALWTTALTVMGCACVVNAARCGRRHCYFTGPVFLLGALASLTYGVGVLPLLRTRWPAPSSIRRAAHDGQMWALQEKATSLSKLQSGQRTRTNPRARMPQSR